MRHGRESALILDLLDPQDQQEQLFPIEHQLRATLPLLPPVTQLRGTQQQPQDPYQHHHLWTYVSLFVTVTIMLHIVLYMYVQYYNMLLILYLFYIYILILCKL